MSCFKKGELILSSKPYACVLSDKEKKKRCDYCFQKNDLLKRCSQCSFFYFCNKQCQSLAWEDHKEECKFIKENQHKSYIFQSIRLLALLVMKTKNHGYDKISETVNGQPRYFADLESHVQQIKGNHKQLALMVELLSKFIGKENIPQMDELLKIYGKMVINTFSISNDNTETIGCGLYLGASIFNHSCAPNAEVVFEGTTLNVRAICEIPGRNIENVYISYIEQLDRTAERRRKLQDLYYFTCQCVRCSNTCLDDKLGLFHPNTENIEEKEEHLKEVLKKLVKLAERKEKCPSLILEIALNELSASEEFLGEMNIYRVKLLQFAFEGFILTSQWPEALATGVELVNPYRCTYGEYHPYYCLLLSKVGKLYLLLNRNKEAEKYFVSAEESTRISYGCSHPYYKTVTELLTECRLEMSMGCLS